jgi:hypothetical protein
MYDPRLGYDPVTFGYGTSRRVRSDGTVQITCSVCTKPIISQQYRGFSTAICAVCQGEIEAGRRPEDLIGQQLKVENEQKIDLYNDLKHGFKVSGIVKRAKEVVEEVRKAASKRRRAPLFARKDEEAVKTVKEKKQDDD